LARQERVGDERDLVGSSFHNLDPKAEEGKGTVALVEQNTRWKRR